MRVRLFLLVALVIGVAAPAAAQRPPESFSGRQVTQVRVLVEGVPTTDPAFQKGVRYLLSTQHADGSWYVRSRAVKFQPYFESGFPYGHDQWISAMATGWATAALATALPGQ